ncbi:hypothetical protein AB0J83_33375 [Actinoplanes sp. NPDC049596]|uniref:hypothetical protein n=1 Tax=unclassified Actinoplanes TaxID=2626549 RepID=UPI0034302266
MRVIRVAVAVVLLAAGLAAYAMKQARTPVSFSPVGAYQVGRTTDLWVDRSRTDQLAPLGGTPRLLSVFTWYPAATGGGVESRYAPEGWEGLHRYGLGATFLDKIRTGTWDEVAFAAGSFPVVVLLPDRGAAAPQYTALASRIAAQGYLVVGVTPTYSAGLTVLDGKTVRASAAGRDPKRYQQLLAILAADARFAASRAVTQYGRHADPAKVVYAGHGLGGAAAAEACRADPRCAGSAALGATADPIPGRKADLILTPKAGRKADPTQGPQADTADGPRADLTMGPAGPPLSGPHAFSVDGADELTFTDQALYRLAPPLRWALPLGRIDGRRALEISSAYLTAYLASVTRGAAWNPPVCPEVRPAAMLGR